MITKQNLYSQSNRMLARQPMPLPVGGNVNQSEDTPTDLVNEKFIQILAWNVDKLRRHTRNPEFKEFCLG